MTNKEIITEAAINKFKNGVKPSGEASILIENSSYYKNMYIRKLKNLTAQAEGFEDYTEMLLYDETFNDPELTRTWDMVNERLIIK